MTTKKTVTERLDAGITAFRNLRGSQAEKRAEFEAWLSQDDRWTPEYKDKMRRELRETQARETQESAKTLWQLSALARQESARRLADVKSADAGKAWDYNRLDILSREYAAALRRRPAQYQSDEDYLWSLAQDVAARGDDHERRALALAVREHRQELSHSQPYRALMANPALDTAETEAKSARFLSALAQGEINRSMAAFIPEHDTVGSMRWQADVYGEQAESAPNAA